jgi:hypothetical protein
MPTLPHTTQYSAPMFNVFFLSVLIVTILLHIFMTEELQQCSKNGALVLLTAPDIHFAARFL